MSHLRLNWEPINITPLELIEKCAKKYMHLRNDGVSIMSNGTLIFTANDRNHIYDAKRVMEEASSLIDFSVNQMKDGEYLVTFHDVIVVFVGSEEFKSMRNKIIQHLDELKFPEEVFFQENENEPMDHLLIGLYARGKLQYDAHHFSYHKRVDGDG